MGRPIAAFRTVVLSLTSLALLPSLAAAGDTGAATSGDWSSVVTWTNGVPGANDNAYIGSTYPTGAVANATVFLSQDSAVNTAFVGYGGGTSGTLDLHGHTLTGANLYLGLAGGTGSLTRTGGGTLSLTGGIYEYTGALTMTSADTAAYLSVYSGASATTAAVGNVSTDVYVDPGATLNLGANLTLSQTLDVRGALNANGHAITAGNMYLGYYDGPATLTNHGALTVGNLYVSSQNSPSLANFGLTAADAVTNFYAYGLTSTLPAGAIVQSLSLYSTGGGTPTASTITTTATGNIVQSAYVDPGSTLNLGADLSLTNSLDLRGTLNANGHNISAPNVLLGYYNGPASITNRGTITATNLYVSAQYSPALASFNMLSGDAVSNLSIYSGTAVTTAATGNITTVVTVDPGASLNLGADLSLTSGLDLRGNLNANGHNISAPNTVLGYYNGPFSLTNRGNITAGNLTVSSQYSPSQTAFNLTPTDSVNNLYLYGVDSTFPAGATVQGLNLYSNGNATPRYATASTSATGNVTQYLYVDPGNTLNLGADLSLTSYIDLRGNLNANGHNITAPSITFGYYNGPFSVANRGNITATNLTVSSAYSPSQTTFDLTPADAVSNLYLYGVDTTFPTGATVQNLNLYSNGNATPRYSTATTSAAGNITLNAYVDPGNTLNLGADLSLTNYLDLRGNLNANGHNITVPNINFGYYNGPFSVTNRGNITAGTLAVSSAYSPAQTTFNLTPTDSVSNYYLYGVDSTLPSGASVQGLNLYSNGTATPRFSTASTTSTGNVTQYVYDEVGNTLNLGADLNVISYVDVRGTINANGHGITANSITYGYYNGPAAINNPGPITTNQLSVSSQYSPALGNLTVHSYDSISSLYTYGVNTSFGPGAAVQNLQLYSNGASTPAPSTATTSGPGNVTTYVYDDKGNTLNLGADLTLSQGMDVRGTVNANGHGITTQYIYNGLYDGPAAMNNLGVVTTYSYDSAHGSSAYLTQPGSHINSMDLTGNSLVYVYDANGQTTGLTLDGSNKTDLTIDPGSMMMLEVNGFSPGWVFRWADPTNGGDHIADLQSLINGGEIGFTPLNGGTYTIYSDGNFTYVAVPEPSALLLTAAAAGLVIRRRRKK